MERPQISLSNFQVIEANCRKEAQVKYNSDNNCDYYYGIVVAIKNEVGEITVLDKTITLLQLELLEKHK